MKIKYSKIILLLSISFNVLSQDIVSGGSNSWLLHTPDDGRSTLFLTPGVNGANWNWGNATEFRSDGTIYTKNTTSVHSLHSRTHINIENNNAASGSGTSLFFGHNQDGSNLSIGAIRSSLVNGSSSYRTGHIIFQTANNGLLSDKMILTDNGRLGIGTTSPNVNYRLDVIGNLHVDGRIDTKDICVTPNGFCDFVFDENYKLMGLDSLKGYIEKNKHLPHFPSEKQIVKNGMSITDITLSQTRTIEELVLYTIKQQEIIEKLQKDVEILKSK